MATKDQNASSGDNDNPGPAECFTQDVVSDDVSLNVSLSTPQSSNDFNVVSDVSLRRGSYEGAEEETIEVEPNSISKTISSTTQVPTPNPPPAETGAELLDQMVEAIRRHIIVKPHQAEAIALWVVHAHALNAFRVSPRLHLQSFYLGGNRFRLDRPPTRGT